MHEPELKAPWAIFLAMVFTYVGGFIYNIVLCFVMGEPTDILNSQIAQPVAQIYYNVLGTGGGVFFTAATVVICKLSEKY